MQEKEMTSLYKNSSTVRTTFQVTKTNAQFKDLPNIDEIRIYIKSWFLPTELGEGFKYDVLSLEQYYSNILDKLDYLYEMNAVVSGKQA
jgi:hypothetical protein